MAWSSRAGWLTDGVMMEWTDRLMAVLPKGAARSIQATADDGHAIQADLHPDDRTGMCVVAVTCHPLDFADGSPSLERFPTLLELTEACDQLAPMCLFHTAFPSLPPGERPPPPPGPRVVPCEQLAELRPHHGLHLPEGAGSIIGAVRDA